MNVLPVQSLIDIAKSNDFDVYDIASEVFNHPKFPIWTGSGKSHQHHYGKGGLAQHTYEVVSLCLHNRSVLNLDTIDPIELFLSALYHDVGKIWDYTPTNESTLLDWTSTEHKHKIYHISRSVIVWNSACEKYPAYNKYADAVTHNILAHHGQREWGSPVAPISKAAWLLHICDQMSARMNDADKLQNNKKQ